MLQRADVYLLPDLTHPDQFSGQCVVVIDVLRATTTVVYALHAGARQVIPCLDVAEARRLAEDYAPAVLLGGERGGLPIDGFDLGNSPREYTPEKICGKTIVFTTTNGTRAIVSCRKARQVLLAAFVNVSAVCQRLAQQSSVAIVCAGSEGQITREDVLLAGALVDQALQGKLDHSRLNDAAQLAVDAWRYQADYLRDSSQLVDKLRASRSGRRLIGLGQEADLQAAAEIDKFALVPQLDMADWTIHPAPCGYPQGDSNRAD